MVEELAIDLKECLALLFAARRAVGTTQPKDGRATRAAEVVGDPVPCPCQGEVVVDESPYRKTRPVSRLLDDARG